MKADPVKRGASDDITPDARLEVKAVPNANDNFLNAEKVSIEENYRETIGTK
jgi:hypothetical protein